MEDPPSPPVWDDDHLALDPDQLAGALVRPYLAPIPRPRMPVGDLLAGPEADEFDDLAKAIRVYLRTRGRPGREPHPEPVDQNPLA